MRIETTVIIVEEIKRTKTVHEKLLASLSTPILLKMFNELYGKNGEHELSDIAFDTIVEELENHDYLPESQNGEKITDGLLVETFVDLYGESIKTEVAATEENKYSVEIDERQSNHLELDDLLDLLSMAIKDEDTKYANEIKKRLLQHNRNRKGIKA